MTRISAKMVRQALVALGTSIHSEFVPETIELFDQDGNPVDVQNHMPPGGSTGQVLAKVDDTDFNVVWIDPPSSTPPPDWDPALAYFTNDRVSYDLGSGKRKFKFVEDVPVVTPDEPVPDFDGVPVTHFWDPANTELEVTIDETSPLSSIINTADSPYVAVAFKAISSGLIEIKSEPVDGVYRDMFANFYRKPFSGTSWTYLAQNDNGSGLGHPRIFGSYAPPNIYLLTFTVNSGIDIPSYYGTSKIFIGPNNAATYEAFHFEPEFPIDSVVEIP